VVTKHLPPDAGAALNWLKNRQKELWRDKQEIAFELMTDEQLDAIVYKLTKKASKNEHDQRGED